MEDLPEGLFRNAIDLNRFSNGTSKKLINSYNRIILKAVAELKRIEAMPSAKRPKVRAARLRALLAQTKSSLNTWSVKSVNELAKDLEGIAQIQSDFATQQISKALSPSAKQLLSVNSVEVTPSFAKAVVNADPLDISTNVLSQSLDDAVRGATGNFKLTATQGSQIRMPGGESITKLFRGLAEKNAELFATNVQDGLLTGETTQQIARRLVGNLDFGQKAMSARQLAMAGGESTKMANHQIMAITRTSINQVANKASQEVYKSNSDLTSKYRYVATLDSRTSPICRELDGKEFIYGKGPEPAQHFNCRSTTVAVIDYDKIQEKHPNVKPPSKPLGKRAAAGGSVPSNTTYGKWLQKQPASVKAKTLGKEKAKYFDRLSKKYGPDEAMKKFVRDDGSEVSLKTFKARYGKPEDIKIKPPVKPKPKPKLKPTKKEAAILAAEKKKKAEVQSLKKQLDSLAKDSPSKELTALKKTVYQIAGPELATASQLSAKIQDYLINFKQLDLKNPKHVQWFKTQVAFNSDIIPKDQLKTITPAQLFRRVQDKEVGLLQKKYDKAFKKSLLPKKEAVKRAPLKKWDDKSYLDKNLAGASNVSAVRKQSAAGRKTTGDLFEKPNEKNLGLTKAQLKDTENIIGEWCGDSYVELRGSQLQHAQAVGAQLNPQQVKHLKRYKDIRARSASAQNTWARQADKMEDFISKSPKWKGEPEGLLKGQIEKNGTIFRGMALNDPKVVESIIESYKNGDAGLTMESWTMSRTKAGNFALGEMGHGNHQVILKQVNKYGTSIENYNGQGEREILQPRGVRYRVLKSTTDKWTEKGKAHSMTEIFLEAY